MRVVNSAKMKYKINPSEIKQISTRFNSCRDLKIEHPALDAGGKNDFALNLYVTNFVECDLNCVWTCLSTFKTITSFEVIEQLQNPLMYLKCI